MEKGIGKWTQENVLNHLFLYQWIMPWEALTQILHLCVYGRYVLRLIFFPGYLWQVSMAVSRWHLNMWVKSSVNHPAVWGDANKHLVGWENFSLGLWIFWSHLTSWWILIPMSKKKDIKWNPLKYMWSTLNTLGLL